MPDTRLADTLLRSLDLLGQDGFVRRDRILANLAIAIVKALGGRATKEQFVMRWQALRLGDRPEDGFKECTEAALRLGYVSFADGVYSLTQKSAGDDLNVLIERAFPAFEQVLKRDIQDYDPYIHSAYRTCFPESVKTFLLHAAQATVTSGKIGQVSAERILQEIEQEARDRVVPNPADYSNLFVDWVRSNPKALAPVSASLYALVATLQLFSGHNELASATREALKETELVLDTNFIIQLLCPRTSPWYRAVVEIVALAERLHVTLSIPSVYLKEAQDLIKASNRILSGDVKGAGWIGRPNQIIHEYEKLTREQRVEYMLQIADLSKILKTHQIVVRDVPSDLEDKNLTASLFEYFEAVDAAREHKAVVCDSRALEYVRTEQLKMRSPVPSPWLLTFDGRMLAAEHIHRRALGGRPVSIHATSWLAGIGLMLDFDKGFLDPASISAAWLSLAISPKETFKASEVIDVLSRQMNVSEESRLAFVEGCLHSHLITEFDRKLRRRAHQQYPALISEIVKDGIEKIAKQRDIEAATAARLRERLKEILKEPDTEDKD